MSEIKGSGVTGYNVGAAARLGGEQVSREVFFYQ
jgi:hypothetical protein